MRADALSPVGDVKRHSSGNVVSPTRNSQGGSEEVKVVYDEERRIEHVSEV